MISYNADTIKPKVDLKIFQFSEPPDVVQVIKVGNSYFIHLADEGEYIGPFTSAELYETVSSLPFYIEGWPHIVSREEIATEGDELLNISIESGVVDTSEGTVTATGVDGNSRVLGVGEKIYQGDEISSDQASSINIIFADGSSLSLGENSNVVIDEFIYDPSDSIGEFGLEIVEGVFVFVSGEIAANDPDGVVVNTPIATLGIRGTTVAGRVSADAQGTTISLLNDSDGSTGKVIVTNDAGSVTLDVANSTTHVLSSESLPRDPIVLPSKAIGILYQSSLRSTNTNSEREANQLQSRDNNTGKELKLGDEGNNQEINEDISEAPEEDVKDDNIDLEKEILESQFEDIENISKDAKFIGETTLDQEIKIDDVDVQVMSVQMDRAFQDGEYETKTKEEIARDVMEAEWEARDAMYDAIENEANILVAALSDYSNKPDAIFEMVESSANRLSEDIGFSVKDLDLGGLERDYFEEDYGIAPEDWSSGSNEDKSRGNVEGDNDRKTLEDGENDYKEEEYGEPSVAEVTSFIQDAIYAESLSGLDKLNFGGPIGIDIENEFRHLFNLISGNELYNDDGLTEAEREKRQNEDDQFVGTGADFDVDIIISGTSGDDVINGTSASDGVAAGNGNDTISTGFGDDAVLGGLGDDIIFLGPGNDRAGGDGNFFVPEGTAVTSLTSSIVSVTESAVDGADTIDGGDGNDDISGLGGNDSLIGGDGNDELFGGSGNDNLDLGKGQNLGDGGPGDDTITGGPEFDEIFGQGDNDTLLGNGGDDLIAGGTGDDSINGGDGNDELHGDAGDDTIDGGAGNDTIHPGNGIDIIDAGPGDDLVQNSLGNDTITGGDGADVLKGGLGDDSINGNAGADTIDGEEGADTINGGNDDDVIVGKDGADTINAGSGDDIIQGGVDSDTITTGAGDDTIFYKFRDEGLEVNTNTTVSPNSSDTIIDFSKGDNNFTFSNSEILENSLSTGTLSTGNFFSISSSYDGTNSGASSNSSVFVFDSNKSLYFDPNTSGDGYTLIATVESGATVTNADIIIIE